MKKVVLAVLVLCTVAVHAQRKPKIKGNKQVITVREELPPFTGIELTDDLEIYLEKSSSPGFTIIADDNLIDIFKFDVRDSLLTISSFYRITSKRKLEITVHYNELNSLVVREGKLSMQDVIDAPMINIETYANSRVELRANADVIDIAMQGTSKGDFNLEADSLHITLKERSDLKAYSVTDAIDLELTKNAGSRMDGSTERLTLKMNGNTNLKAQDLKAAVVKADLDETPTARIHAFRDLELIARGSSKLFLFGDPHIEIIEFLDSSELLKRPEKSGGFLGN
ncbi:MAG: DUF2807 domain-containing protein [Eudoraea sp.]|nr:DUF2807 domain-containing protein [Eudoraea sp.]